MPGRYYRKLETIHVNTLPPAAYFVPFDVSDRAPGAFTAREGSSRFIPLDGEWAFSWFPDVELLPVESSAFPRSVRCRDTIRVPSCWQLYTERGYDAPNYINQDYPFPVDPPHLPDVIPAGLYRRSVTFTKFEDMRYIINFDGVSSCFYLWVNGGFAGFSEVSHCVSQFDITDLIVSGRNTFEVLVVKWCTGSYMEDQDFFRLSGIFRSVYIFGRDIDSVSDISVKTSLTGEDTAEIRTEISFYSGLPDVRYELTAPNGEFVSAGGLTELRQISVPSPVLWNPEQPACYTLKIFCGNEVIPVAVGIKEAKIKDGTLYLNGRKIKLRGVNRHDSDANTGYAMTMKQMLADIKIIKDANCNTVRTSHYPNDPRFPGLCDKLGLLLIDEADLESHGMGYNYGDWKWDYWAHLCDTPEWRESCLDRARRLYERDKNHACVLMWSLGNESGCGENHRGMAEYIRSRDENAIIHYENAHLIYEEKVGRDFSDISDVESRMYASLDYLKEYLEDGTKTKPFFYCEYVCSTSTGDIPLHWKEFEKYDKYLGGCVWELTDHSVNLNPSGRAYRYGGDFGDYPNDGISCADGIIFPDRTPRPGYFDMKETYRPFDATFENGTLTVTNKLFFSTLDNYNFLIIFENDGEPFSKIRPDTSGIGPGESREIGIRLPESGARLFTMTVYALRNGAKNFTRDEADIAGHKQFILRREGITIVPSAPQLSYKEDRFCYVVSDGKAEYTYSKNKGCFISVTVGSRELLTRNTGFSLFRTGPNGTLPAGWQRARFDHIQQKTYSSVLTEYDDNTVSIKSELSFASPAMPNAVKATVEYFFEGNGMMTVRVEGSRCEGVPVLPRFGFELGVTGDFEELSYIGYGPRESYCDRFESCLLSKFDTSVTENFVPYVKPTENGAHYGTGLMYLTSSDGIRLTFAYPRPEGFSFNAKHFTDRDLLEVRHNDELVTRDETIINIDYKKSADNPGDGKDPGRLFDEEKFSMNFAMTISRLF